MLKLFIIDCPYLQNADFFNITFLSHSLIKIPDVDTLKFEKCRLIGDFDFAAAMKNLKYLTVIEMVDGGGEGAGGQLIKLEINDSKLSESRFWKM